MVIPGLFMSVWKWSRVAQVVDTPDPVNSELDTKQLKEEIQKWKQMTAPFPSAILLAVRCDVRYTAEEYDIYKKIKNAWADKSFLHNLIIVFTFGDRQDKDLAEELKTVCPELQNVLRDSNNNYVCFNNIVSTFLLILSYNPEGRFVDRTDWRASLCCPEKTGGWAGRRRWPLGGSKQHNQRPPPTLLDTNSTWFDEPSQPTSQRRQRETCIGCHNSTYFNLF